MFNQTNHSLQGLAVLLGASIPGNDALNAEGIKSSVIEGIPGIFLTTELMCSAEVRSLEARGFATRLIFQIHTGDT